MMHPGEVLRLLSPVWLVMQKKKKKMQFGIFVFIEAQEINLQGNLQGSKCDGDCILL